VRVLTEDFAPFNYMGENGSVEGKSSEIVRLILASMGMHARIEMMNMADAYQIISTEPNTAFYSAARNPQREQAFKWVGPIGAYDKTIYAKSGAEYNITSLEDAKKAKSICVVQSDDRQQMLSGLGFENLVMKQKDAQCVNALSLGEVQLWFGSADTLPYAEAEAGVENGGIVPALHVESTELYIMFSNETSDEVVQRWQNALDDMKRGGVYYNANAEK
jgi:polar amino acid transport system substrate-binding protein